VFAPGRPRPLVVGTPGPRGTGRAAPGGYVVSGRWGFASGVSYADWLLGVFLSNEVPPLCVGIARRALGEIAVLADRTARFPGGPALSERAVFRKELGRAQMRVRAARLVHRDAVETALAAAYAGDDLGGAHAAVAAASVYTVETCAEVIADLFRYGGGRVLSLASPLQRYLRDALAACQRIGVSEENYERLGRLRVAPADR